MFRTFSLVELRFPSRWLAPEERRHQCRHPGPPQNSDVVQFVILWVDRLCAPVDDLRDTVRRSIRLLIVLIHHANGSSEKRLEKFVHDKPRPFASDGLGKPPESF